VLYLRQGEKVSIEVDPMKSDAVDWLARERRPPR